MIKSAADSVSGNSAMGWLTLAVVVYVFWILAKNM
jgi:hypothetical protein